MDEHTKDTSLASDVPPNSPVTPLTPILSPRVFETPIFDTLLLNVSFKIFTKVATLRLNSVADHVIRPTQTAFMQGRYILDGVVTLHETDRKSVV